jgi:tetratricopeptide (TPR) repeat protein
MIRPSLALACVLLAAHAVPAPARTVAAPTAAQPASQDRILVLPFENAGSDALSHWLGEATAVLVADGLKARGHAVISREERVRAFEELHLPLSATLSRATLIKIAQLLGAAELVVGKFTVEDRQLSIQANPIRVDAGRVRPPVAERGPLTDLFELHDRLVEHLAPGTSRRGEAPVRPPLQAFESYIKGLVAATPAARATFLESAIQDAPGFDRARLGLWDVRTDQGDHAAALAVVRAVPGTSPVSARARFFAALSLLNLARYDEAFAAFTELLPAVEAAEGGRPTSAALSNNLGVIQLRRGGSTQAGTAVYFLTKATEADRADIDYCFNLGYAYALDRNFQAAIYWLREAVRRDPTDADAHFVLAAALHGTGGAVEAGRERDLARQLSSRYEELARSSTDRQAVPRGLERVQLDPEGSGSLHASVIVGSSAQRDQRDLATFHLDRGRRLFEREQDGEALTELRRAVYLSPYEAQAHLLVGRIYLRAGRPDEAVDALKISIWSADSAAARVVLAEAYLKTGDTKRARLEAERALTMDPASAEAKRVLARIQLE